jgi:hypothetical protein
VVPRSGKSRPGMARRGSRCNGLVAVQEQEHKRVYKRWQREAPMHLWQLDLVGGLRGVHRGDAPLRGPVRGLVG